MNSFSSLLVASVFSIAALLFSACGVQDDEPAPPEPYMIEAPAQGGGGTALACRPAIVDRIVLDHTTWMCRCPLVGGDSGCAYECNDCSLEPRL